MATTDINVGEQYAGSKGQIYAVNGKNLRVLDDEFAGQIIQKARKARESDSLTPAFDNYLDSSTDEQFMDDLFPPDLVADGGLWDDSDFTRWFWETYESEGVITKPGQAVFLDGGNTEHVNLTAGESIPFN